MNQTEITYKINNKYELILVNDNDLMLETFYNGFKVVLINKDTIKHIYINDHELRNMPIVSTSTAEKVVASFLEMNEGEYDLAVTSDIHMHVFHMKFTIALSQCKYIKRVVIAGDLFLKWKYESQPYSRRTATDAICKILTDNIDMIYVSDKTIICDSDLKENNKLIWLKGNHDKDSSVPETFRDLQTKINSLPWIYNANVGKYMFRIQHGAYLDNENPTDDRDDADKIRPEFNRYMSKNNYLILGHRTQYYFDKLNKTVETYLKENKHTVYQVDIGKFRITNESTDDGPIYISRGQRNKDWEYNAYDLFWSCAQELVTKKSHLICTNNSRLCTPLKTSDKFYEYEMYGGDVNKYIFINILLVIFISVILIIIWVLISKETNKNKINDHD